MAGLANGQIVVLYSPDTSHNGAKLVMSKGPPRKITVEDMSDALSAPAILTPHALPMFRDMDPGRGTKRKREKDRMDPRKSRRPDLPVTGPGKGGRVGASATQHVVQNLVRDTTRDVDVSIHSCRRVEFDSSEWSIGFRALLLDRLWMTDDFYFYFAASRSPAQVCRNCRDGPQVDWW